MLQEIHEFEYKLNLMSDHLYMGVLTIRKSNSNKWGPGTWKIMSKYTGTKQ